MIRTVPLEQVDERHLQSLIDNAVREGRDLEYKREIISGNDESWRELLKGVVALANAAGGDLIFGMAEQQGEAASLHGIITTPGDNEIRRLSEIIQSSVEPRLIGVRMHPVNLSGGGYALVVRVPQSWQPPHRTNFKGWTKYFARNSAGAYELSVDQLRAVFVGGAEAERRLLDFRVERIARIKGGLTALATGSGQLLLHVVPLQPGTVLDVTALNGAAVDSFAPMSSTRFGGYSPRFNFDGLSLLSNQTDRSGASHTLAMTQVFRNGAVETARAMMLFDIEAHRRALTYGNAIPDLIGAIPRMVRGLLAQGVLGPFAIMVSLLDVRDSTMLFPNKMFIEPPSNTTHDDLLFPPALLEATGFEDGWQVVLKPTLDGWWNAYGLDRCDSCFDAAGKWTGCKF